MITSNYLALSDQGIETLLIVSLQVKEKYTAVVLSSFILMRHRWHHSLKELR